MTHKENKEGKATDYQRLISDTVNALPVNKQIEVYHFAQYIKSTGKRRAIKRQPAKRKSISDLFGTVRSKVTDASINHDKYLYE